MAEIAAEAAIAAMAAVAAIAAIAAIVATSDSRQIVAIAGKVVTAAEAARVSTPAVQLQKLQWLPKL